MPNMIPYGRQDITAADIEEVIKVLSSDFLTQSPIVPKFEEKLIELTKRSMLRQSIVQLQRYI